MRISDDGHLSDAMVRSAEQVYAAEALRVADGGRQCRRVQFLHRQHQRIRDDHQARARVPDRLHWGQEGAERIVQAGPYQHEQWLLIIFIRACFSISRSLGLTINNASLVIRQAPPVSIPMNLRPTARQRWCRDESRLRLRKYFR